MSLTDSAQVSLLQRFLDLSAKRQELLSSNIANVDTPGYHARDIDFRSEMQRALNDPETDPQEPFVREVPGLISRPDGNNVSVDRESLLLSEVQLQFSIAEQILKARFKNLSTAIHEGGMSS